MVASLAIIAIKFVSEPKILLNKKARSSTISVYMDYM